MKLVSEIYVKKLLQNINAQKANEYYNIPPKMVKMLINYILVNKIFPDDIKKLQYVLFSRTNDD